MGLLDDLVKLQFGAPLTQSLFQIGSMIRENDAAEKIAPIVTRFREELDKTPDVSKRYELAARTLLDLSKAVGPEGTGTNVYQTASKSIASIPEMILRGAAGQSEIDIADVQRKILQQKFEAGEASLPPGSIAARLTGTAGMPMAKAELMSEIDKPYIPYLTEKLSVSASTKEKQQKFNQELASLMVHYLGADYLKSIPKDMMGYFVDGNFDLAGLVNTIVKKHYGKNAKPEDVKKVTDGVYSAVSAFGLAQSVGPHALETLRANQQAMAAQLNNLIAQYKLNADIAKAAAEMVSKDISLMADPERLKATFLRTYNDIATRVYGQTGEAGAGGGEGGEDIVRKYSEYLKSLENQQTAQPKPTQPGMRPVIPSDTAKVPAPTTSPPAALDSAEATRRRLQELQRKTEEVIKRLYGGTNWPQP